MEEERRRSNPQNAEVALTPSAVNMAEFPAVKLAPVGAVRAGKGLMVGLSTPPKNSFGQRIALLLLTGSPLEEEGREGSGTNADPSGHETKKPPTRETISRGD